MIKTIQKKISLIDINKFVYLAIFVMLAGFIMNGCILKICNFISNDLERNVDRILFIIEGSIISVTLALIFIKQPKKIFCIYTFSGIIFLLYYLLFPSNRHAMLIGSTSFFLYNLTSFILFTEISKDKKMFEMLIKITKYVFLFSIIYFIILLIKNETLYNLWLAKYFLFTNIFMFYDFYKNKRITSGIVSIICLMILGTTGSRTYFIVSVLFMIMNLTIILTRKIKKMPITKRKLVIISVVILLISIIILLMNYQRIFNGLYNFFSKSGIEIRILRLLSTGNFFTSNDRINTIYPMSIDLIKQNWIFGTGICGDRTRIFEKYQQTNRIQTGVDITGYYSHNLILELYSNFGVIISTLIVGTVVYGYYKTIKDRRKNISCIVCLSFISILPLMLTGTMWNNIYLWSLLGLICANILNRDVELKESQEKNIVMLLDNAFEPDIRVYKEAKYLIRDGYNVEIVCLDKKNRYVDKSIEIYDEIKIKRIFCRTSKTTKLIENNHIIEKLKLVVYTWWLIKFIIKAKKYLQYKDFEILHCHDLIMAFIGVTFFKNKKVVFDMHEYYGDHKNRFKNLIIKGMVRYTQNKAEWIIYVNEFQKHQCKEKNMSKLVEIPNYPERNIFKDVKKTKNDKLRISYIGKVRDFKSLSRLADISGLNDKLDIAIYGNGSEYDKLLRYLKKNGREEILKGEYNRFKTDTRHI